MRGFPSALNVRVLEFISGKLTLGGGFKYVSLCSLGKNDPIWPLRIFFNWVEITNIRTWLAHPALPIGNVLNRLIPRQAMFLDWSVYTWLLAGCTFFCLFGDKYVFNFSGGNFRSTTFLPSWHFVPIRTILRYVELRKYFNDHDLRL